MDNNMMMQAMQAMQQMQAKLAEVEQGLKNLSVTETGGDGLVSVTVTGEMRIASIVLDQEKLGSEEKEVVEDLIASTVNRALAGAEGMKQNALQQATGGMIPNIPGLNFPGM